MMLLMLMLEPSDAWGVGAIYKSTLLDREIGVELNPNGNLYKLDLWDLIVCSLRI